MNGRLHDVKAMFLGLERQAFWHNKQTLRKADVILGLVIGCSSYALD